MKRIAAIAIINDHRMLMGKRRNNGKFTNPGGHLNEGEDPLAGAVREVKEETGLNLDPHLFRFLEKRVVKKPDGTKIEVHGYRVDLRSKPSTSMKEDPDREVQRWQWIKLDTDLDHIKDNLHVPLEDNVLLGNILKDKPMKKHVRRFWESAKKVGRGGFASEEAHKKEGEARCCDKCEAMKALGFKPVPHDDKIPDDKLKAGIKVEKEHTKDPEVAKVIAKGHFKEFPPKKGKEDYYEGLDKMEEKLKKQAFWKGFFGA